MPTAFLRDVLKLPAEIPMHPSDKNDVQEFYLMCDDVTTHSALAAAGSASISQGTRDHT